MPAIPRRADERPGRAGPMQKEDHRIRLVSLVVVRHEDRVFRFAAIGSLVDALVESVLDLVGGTGRSQSRAEQATEQQ